MEKIIKTLPELKSIIDANKFHTFDYTEGFSVSDGIEIFEIDIGVVTNLFLPTPPPEGYHIQLTGNYDEDEHTEWQPFLDENQWKIYPLLANIIRVFLPNVEGVSFQLLYTQYPQGFISVIAKPYKAIQS